MEELEESRRKAIPWEELKESRRRASEEAEADSLLEARYSSDARSESIEKIIRITRTFFFIAVVWAHLFPSVSLCVFFYFFISISWTLTIRCIVSRSRSFSFVRRFVCGSTD